MAGEGVEQVELVRPWEAVEEADGAPVLVSPASGGVQAFHHLDKTDTFAVDVTVADADPDSFDAPVLPGGGSRTRTRCGSTRSRSWTAT